MIIEAKKSENESRMDTPRCSVTGLLFSKSARGSS